MSLFSPPWVFILSRRFIFSRRIACSIEKSLTPTLGRLPFPRATLFAPRRFASRLEPPADFPFSLAVFPCFLADGKTTVSPPPSPTIFPISTSPNSPPSPLLLPPTHLPLQPQRLSPPLPQHPTLPPLLFLWLTSSPLSPPSSFTLPPPPFSLGCSRLFTRRCSGRTSGRA